jgi:large subunit ribosomal protein L17
MRHNARVATFGRKTGPRRALLRGLVNSLVEHGRIKTTLAKAKELRLHVEPAVTLSKKGTLHARRLLLARYPNEKTVTILMSDLGPRFASRPGGYTRIMKIGQRPGDRAEMAFIEFVDFVPGGKAVDATPVKASKKKTAKKTASATDAAAETKAPVKIKTNTRVAAAKKKRLRKLQGDARRVQRA